MPATRWPQGSEAVTELPCPKPARKTPAGPSRPIRLAAHSRSAVEPDISKTEHVGLGRQAGDAANVPRASDFRSPDLRRRLHPPTCLQACGTRSSASNNLTAGLSLVAMRTVPDMDQQAVSRILDRRPI